MTQLAQAWPGLSGAGAARLAAGDRRLVVTGAGGWLGRATLEGLHQCLGDAFHRRVVCFGSKARRLSLRGGLVVEQRALADLRALKAAPTIVLHNACLTRDRAETMSGADYITANRAISRLVLDALEPIGGRAVFLPSSGAAYRAEDPSAPEALRLYGRLKLEDEAAFADWANQAGASAALVRVFNLSGPYINKLGSYALAGFILDALAGRPIQVRATRPVFRSYVAIRELMSIVLGLLTSEAPTVVRFDTGGDQALEMGDIAEAVAATLNPALAVERPALISTDADFYVGDAAAYSALRAAHGAETVSFADQIRETATYLTNPAESV
jgi:nucleoside-diphosphate-sugar epimerase